MMKCLPSQGTPPPNTAADTAHGPQRTQHTTQPALRPHRATSRVEDRPPQTRRPHSIGLCLPLSEGPDLGLYKILLYFEAYYVHESIIFVANTTIFGGTPLPPFIAHTITQYILNGGRKRKPGASRSRRARAVWVIAPSSLSGEDSYFVET